MLIISGSAITISARANALTAGRRPASAVGSLRTQFIQRQFSITVLVEFAERLWRVLDFLFIDHAVVVRIERDHQWRDWRTPLAIWSAVTIAWRTIHLASSAVALRRSFPPRRLATVLCKGHRWQRKSQRHQECCCLFHIVFFFSSDGFNRLS